MSAPLVDGPLLRAILQDCRRHTLTLVSNITSDNFYRQSHLDFSPVGWHLGHIAYTESLWIVEQLAGWPRIRSQYEQLFCADGLPKSQRHNLPTLSETLIYLDEVRLQALTYLESGPSLSREVLRLWHWLIQHESQHAETIAMVLAMHRLNSKTLSCLPTQSIAACKTDRTEMIRVEAGQYSQGADDPEAIDNERPSHSVATADFWIDRMPVTCQQYREFIESGGYQTRQWWCDDGWRWLQSSGVSVPFYWLAGEFEHHPVCGVSWYEADAYARFVGKRLPTEAEWEKAAISEARCEHMLGNVWEWTDSWFKAYPGFQPFPYKGYSQTYFDGAHRVLRGGSWASPPAIVRASFRNWYHPHRRELFAGLRCAI
ncbi:MAG: SUMF1/EgtB/PvdO family nonheme iron enzyme [Cyanobacteria bacterium J06621_11]